MFVATGGTALRLFVPNLLSAIYTTIYRIALHFHASCNIFAILIRFALLILPTSNGWYVFALLIVMQPQHT